MVAMVTNGPLLRSGEWMGGMWWPQMAAWPLFSHTMWISFSTERGKSDKKNRIFPSSRSFPTFHAHLWKKPTIRMYLCSITTNLHSVSASIRMRIIITIERSATATTPMYVGTTMKNRKAFQAIAWYRLRIVFFCWSPRVWVSECCVYKLWLPNNFHVIWHN